MVVRIEIIDKIFAGQDSIFKAGQILTLIIIVGKSSEIFAFKHFTDSGLLIEKCNFRLLKAMAFDTFAVACILTIGTIVNRFQVIFRKPGFQKKLSLFVREFTNGLFQCDKSILVSFKKSSALRYRNRRNSLIKLLITGHMGINISSTLFKQFPVSVLLCLKAFYNGIILGICECHGILL